MQLRRNALILFLGVASQGAIAATLTVDAPTPYAVSDGLCSFVEAIDNANDDAMTHADCEAGTGADVVSLSVDVVLDGTATFAADGVNGLPSLTGDIVIDGYGHFVERDSGAAGFRLLHVSPGALAALRRLTIRGGLSNVGFDNGGGIFNAGRLTISDSTIENNEVASIFPNGGGIYNTGTLDIINSTIRDNLAVDGIFSGGGGVYSAPGSSLSMNNVEVMQNSARTGGGVYTSASTSIDNSRFLDNVAVDRGGAIQFLGTLGIAGYEINNSEFIGNLVIGLGDGFSKGGGAIANGGEDLRIFGSFFANNSVAGDGAGGALLNSLGTAVVRATQFIGNHADGTLPGGAITNVGFSSEVHLTGSIIRNNTSATEAGGLYTQSGGFYVTDSVIEGNEAVDGGGISAGGSNTDSFFIKRTSIIGNHASRFGGGGYFVGSLTTTFIDNSTISGNTVANGGIGGGIMLNMGGQVEITHTAVIENVNTTFVNSVGGLHLFAGTASIGSNLIANNPNRDCSATNSSTSLDFNISTGLEVADPLFGNDRWCSFLTSAPNDLLETDPLVDALAANGNVSPTHLLQPGSPAANYIPFDCPPSLEGVDQRGVARPAGSCDVGPVSDEAAELPTVYFPLAASIIDDEANFAGAHFVDLLVDNSAGTLAAPGMDLSLFVSVRGTAASGVDYAQNFPIPTVFTFDSLNWPAPGTSRTLRLGITPIPDDLIESDETIELSVQLTGPGVLGVQTDHIVTLRDAPQLIYACNGFLPPLQEPLVTRNSSMRSIPAKIQIIGPVGATLGTADLPDTPEIVVVAPDGTTYGNSVVDDAALDPVARSNIENLFAFDPVDRTWHYRVDTDQFPSIGVYTVSARFPPDSVAALDPTCTQTFELTAR